MIYIVDDDPSIIEMVSKTLAREGREVKGFERAADALQSLGADEPSLIVSDISMPEMDGLRFREEYARMFPARNTPFIFLSSHGDADTIVKGLDLGADDYITKPVVPAVLAAKVRSLLRRTERAGVSVFRGSLEKISFMNLIKFCELNGLNGDLDIESADLDVTVRFQAGNMLVDDSVGDFDELLSKLFDLAEGNFVIRSRAVDYGEIAEAALAPEECEKEPACMATGQLSGVKAGERLFQIQTEHVNYPDSRVVSIVVLDGKTVMKRKTDVLSTREVPEIERIIREEHARVEAEVREKLGSLKAKKPAEESSGDRFNRLFDQGFDRYREGDYAGALEAWEEARSIDPSNNTLGININIVKNKMKEA